MYEYREEVTLRSHTAHVHHVEEAIRTKKVLMYKSIFNLKFYVITYYVACVWG